MSETGISSETIHRLQAGAAIRKIVRSPAAVVNRPGIHGSRVVGVAAGRSVGSAVERNRAKRRLRACMDGLLPRLTPGWDIILLARKPIVSAKFIPFKQLFPNYSTGLAC